jgi:hypothetical protein
MRRASECRVSCSLYKSYAPGGVFTSAIEKILRAPDLDAYTIATLGVEGCGLGVGLGFGGLGGWGLAVGVWG